MHANKKTTFILGAGASCPYGYPTGKELIQKILNACGNTIYVPFPSNSDITPSVSSLSGLFNTLNKYKSTIEGDSDFSNKNFTHTPSSGNRNTYSHRNIKETTFLRISLGDINEIKYYKADLLNLTQPQSIALLMITHR